MNFLAKVFLILEIVRTIECSNNVSDKDCISNVMLSKSNRSKASEHNVTIVHATLDQNFKWNQVIATNGTSDLEDLPHYVVPEVSSYERGANAAVKL